MTDMDYVLSLFNCGVGILTLGVVGCALWLIHKRYPPGPPKEPK